uniref:Putative secreted protein n=1 Tax=Ixodes ricinus TaxID=34613 RepID=A0A6B0U4A3_IXORI
MGAASFLLLGNIALQLFQQANVQAVFVRSAKGHQAVCKLSGDPTLFQHVHQQVVKVPIHNIARDRVDSVRQLSLID